MDGWTRRGPLDVVSFFGLLVVMFVVAPAAPAVIADLVCRWLLPGIRWQSRLWMGFAIGFVAAVLTLPFCFVMAYPPLSFYPTVFLGTSSLGAAACLAVCGCWSWWRTRFRNNGN